MFEVLRVRYIKPILSLTEDYVIKSIISGFLSIWAILSDIFYTEIEIVFLLLFVIIIDNITGIRRSKKEGKEVLSIGLRQTVVKIIEYFVALGILTAIANVFGKSDLENWVGKVLDLAANIDWFGYFYVIITELVSISENMFGKNASPTKMIKRLSDRIFQKAEEELDEN